jgi:hypothetical protein
MSNSRYDYTILGLILGSLLGMALGITVFFTQSTAAVGATFYCGAFFGAVSGFLIDRARRLKRRT